MPKNWGWRPRCWGFIWLDVGAFIIGELAWSRRWGIEIAFGREPITVRTGAQLFQQDTEVPPGGTYVGEVGSIHGGGDQVHYSVRPAERPQGAPELYVLEEDED